MSVRCGCHVWILLSGRLSVMGMNESIIRPAINLTYKHLVLCFHAQDLLALLAEHATSADDINTILDRIHKNHR